jgi:MscS family membrane protein
MNERVLSFFNEFKTNFLQGSFLGIEVPDLCKFLGFLVGGWLVGKLSKKPLALWIERLTPKDDHTTSVRFARNFQRLSFLFVFALVLNMGAIDVLHLPGWLWLRLRHLPVILLAIASTLLALQIIDVALLGLQKKWNNTRSNVDELLVDFLRRGIRIFIILLAVLVTAQKMELPVTSAIAGLGIGGAAIALASQNLLANVIGTMEVVADKLYHVGDRIQFDGFDGFVTHVGLRSTKIRAISGEEIIVPNKRMAEVQVRNFTREGFVRTSLVTGLTYATSHERLREAQGILDAIFKARSDVQSYQIYLKNLAAYSLELEVVFWAQYTTSREFNELVSQLQLEIKRRFDEAKLDFAFPTQTLHLAGR